VENLRGWVGDTAGTPQGRPSLTTGRRAASRPACYGAGGCRRAWSPGGVARRAARISASASYFTVTSAMCRRSASNWSFERFAHTPRSLVAASRMISPTRAARPASVFNGVWSSTRRSGMSDVAERKWERDRRGAIEGREKRPETKAAVADGPTFPFSKRSSRRSPCSRDAPNRGTFDVAHLLGLRR